MRSAVSSKFNGKFGTHDAEASKAAMTTIGLTGIGNLVTSSRAQASALFDVVTGVGIKKAIYYGAVGLDGVAGSG